MLKIIFITIVGNIIGLGHLNRCLSLAKEANHNKLSTEFFLFSDEEGALQIRQSGYNYLLYPFSELNSQSIKEDLDKIGPIDAVIIDFSHPIILKEKEKIQGLLDYIHKKVKEIILIDSVEEQSLRTLMPNLPISVIVVPYAGKIIQQKKAWRYLVGSIYAVLSPEYTNLKKRIVNKKANCLLVSCGGSDPKKLTLLALEGIENISEILNVRVIVGPLFDDNLKMTLNLMTNRSKHCINLIEAPKTLVSHLLWCDLAISTSGLTKYELAATSTPAILISIDEFHHAANKSFSEIGSIVDLGVNVTPMVISDKVSQLLLDYDTRKNMASAGYQAVDGNGAKRLIKEIINVTE